MSFYVASKGRHGPMWIEWRKRGVPIVSRWIDRWSEGRIPDADRHWLNIEADIRACDILVLYSEHGDVQRGALVEMGMALMAGKQVLYVAPDDVTTAIHHPHAARRNSLEEIFVTYVSNS